MTSRRSSLVAPAAALVLTVVLGFGWLVLDGRAQAQEGTGSGAAAAGSGEGTGQLACDDADLPRVYFDFDDPGVRADQERALEHIAACMRAYPDRRLRIEGHTDERGTSEFNMAVSERHADSVRRYLERLGIESSRLETAHFGEERPLCTGHDESCWRQNRRTEVHWIEATPVGDGE